MKKNVGMSRRRFVGAVGAGVGAAVIGGAGLVHAEESPPIEVHPTGTGHYDGPDGLLNAVKEVEPNGTILVYAGTYDLGDDPEPEDPPLPPVPAEELGNILFINRPMTIMGVGGMPIIKSPHRPQTDYGRAGVMASEGAVVQVDIPRTTLPPEFGGPMETEGSRSVKLKNLHLESTVYNDLEEDPDLPYVVDGAVVQDNASNSIEIDNCKLYGAENGVHLALDFGSRYLKWNASIFGIYSNYKSLNLLPAYAFPNFPEGYNLTFDEYENPIMDPEPYPEYYAVSGDIIVKNTDMKSQTSLDWIGWYGPAYGLDYVEFNNCTYTSWGNMEYESPKNQGNYGITITQKNAFQVVIPGLELAEDILPTNPDTQIMIKNNTIRCAQPICVFMALGHQEITDNYLEAYGVLYFGGLTTNTGILACMWEDAPTNTALIANNEIHHWIPEGFVISASILGGTGLPDPSGQAHGLYNASVLNNTVIGDTIEYPENVFLPTAPCMYGIASSSDIKNSHFAGNDLSGLTTSLAQVFLRTMLIPPFPPIYQPPQLFEMNDFGPYTDPVSGIGGPGNVFGSLQLSYDNVPFFPNPNPPPPAFSNLNYHNLLTKGGYVDFGSNNICQNNDFSKCMLYNEDGTLRGVLGGWDVGIPNTHPDKTGVIDYLSCISLFGEEAEVFEHAKLGTKYFPMGTSMCTQIAWDENSSNNVQNWDVFCKDNPGPTMAHLNELRAKIAEQQAKFNAKHPDLEDQEISTESFRR